MARVLVIDDDQLFVKLMVHALKQRGHEVEFALDGIAGVRMFAASAFDAVVCDIVMPEQEGVQTIKQIRLARSDVAIVAISGGLSFSHSANIDVLEIAGKLGADITLKKPFQLSELSSAVETALSARRGAAACARA
ncbi:MAG: response regulator [Alphaproteobacteria bacterium]|nr:response regulator [Alphaproteobacteria bacterium]